MQEAVIRPPSNGGLYRATWILRAPVLGTALGGVLLTVPPQTQEVYRVLAEGTSGLQLAAALIFLSLASVGAWWVTRWLTIHLASAEEIQSDSLFGILLRWTPIILGAGLLALTGFGLSNAARDSRLVDLNPWLTQRSRSLAQLQDTLNQLHHTAARLRYGAYALWFASLIFFTVAARTRKRPFSWLNPQWTRNLKAVVWTPVLALVAIGLLLSTWVNLAEYLGSIALVLLFTTWLVFTLSVSAVCSNAWRTSLVLLAVIWALTLSAFNLNNDHVLARTLTPNNRVLWDAAGPQRSFDSWIASRQDYEHFAQARVPYPIFIVAARGGGSYALAQAALFLGRMQDRCPIFSQHVFAMSTVSGGSIGSAAFAAYSKEHVTNGAWQACDFASLKKGAAESQLADFAGRDLLSPVLGSALFADLLQRFVPFASARLDRANAIAAAIERNWSLADSKAENPFAEAFLDQWEPTSATPALLINTTEVESGRRRVISPFPVNPSRPAAAAWFYDPPGVAPFFRLTGTSPEPVKADLPLSQAVEISARFPWVLPAATFPRGKAAIHLVDGGYFDNSGIETAIDLIEALNALRNEYQRATLPPDDPHKRNFELYLLIVTGSNVAVPQDTLGRGDAKELTAPVLALVSARDGRGELTAQRAQSIRYLGDSGTGPVKTYEVMQPATFNEQDLPLSLGFQLSRASSQIIGAQLSHPSECGHMNPTTDSDIGPTAETDPRGARMGDINHGNSCQQCLIGLLLTTGTTNTDSQFPCELPTSGTVAKSSQDRKEPTAVPRNASKK